MGPIHPRDKIQVGRRLAAAAAHIIYGKKNTWTGPVFIGCRLNTTNKTLTLIVDQEKLNGENIVLSYFTPFNDSVRVPDATTTRIQLSGEAGWVKV